MTETVELTDILDVGCGSDAKGTVNIDLSPQKWLHRADNIDTKKVSNFVVADCHHLPFKDNTFYIVLSRHVLEHKGIDATKMCKEMLRVSRDKVIIRVPNYFRASKFNIGHDKIFTPIAFHILFRNYKHKVRLTGFGWEQVYFPINKIAVLLRSVKIRGSIPNPIHFLPCPIPTEIEAIIEKE